MTEGTISGVVCRGGRLSALVVLLALAAGAVGCSRAPAFRPHVIFITWDSVRADHVSCLGYERPTTPALDDICRDAVVFDQAYSSHNWTRTSYTALLTSRRVWELPGERMTRAMTTLPEALSAAGYWSLGIVQNPNLSPEFAFDQGFDQYVELAQTLPPGAITDAVVEQLDALPPDRPVFLFVHYQAAHWPYRADGPFVGEFLRPDSEPIAYEDANALLESHGSGFDASEAEASRKVQYLLDLYDGALRETDEALRSLVEALEARSMWRDSFIVVASDHGDEFGERGGFGHAHENLFPELTHIPLVVRFPDAAAIAPRRVSALVQLVDLFPTVVGLLGLDPVEHLSGTNLLPLDDLEEQPRLAFSSFGPWVAIRNRRSTLVGHFEGNRQYWFYDRETDPQERQPLPDAEARPDYPTLKRAAEAWYRVYRQNADAAPSEEAVPISDDLRERLKSLGYVQ